MTKQYKEYVIRIKYKTNDRGRVFIGYINQVHYHDREPHNRLAHAHSASIFFCVPDKEDIIRELMYHVIE